MQSTRCLDFPFLLRTCANHRLKTRQYLVTWDFTGRCGGGIPRSFYSKLREAGSFQKIQKSVLITNDQETALRIEHLVKRYGGKCRTFAVIAHVRN